MAEHRTIRLALTVLALLALLTALTAKLMKYDPYPANAGEYVTVWIKIENPGLGSPSEDVQLRVVPEYPFSLEPGETGLEEIGKL